MQQMKNPDPKTGVGCRWVELVGSSDEVLAIIQVVHVTEQRCSGGQVLRLREQRIEPVVTDRWVIDEVAALEGAGVVSIPEEADHRTFVVEVLVGPVFQESQEVVHPAIDSKRPGRVAVQVDEGHRFSGCDRHAVIGGSRALPCYSAVGDQRCYEASVDGDFARRAYTSRDAARRA